MKKMRYAVIFIMLLISGNFLRLFLEKGNEPKVKINEEILYQKDKAKKENDLSGTSEKYDVNIITFEELIKLGFSKSKATKIIEFKDGMGIIGNLNEFGNISGLGESGLRQIKKYMYVDREKVKDPAENYAGRNFKKYNINNLDEAALKRIGFTKKEVKEVINILESERFYSNIDLEKAIGKKRYEELEKHIKFTD